MRADKLLIFSIAVIFSFCAAAGGYTGDARGAATSRGGRILIVNDALTGHSGILTAVSPSGIRTISGSGNDEGDRTSEVYRILAVLEGRIEDPRLIQKVKDKLFTLKGDRLHMVVSLSERITDRNRGAETDIAFFLLTTLIIFS